MALFVLLRASEPLDAVVISIPGRELEECLWAPFRSTQGLALWACPSSCPVDCVQAAS